MSVVDNGQWMCLTAIAESIFAACVLPGAWPAAIAIGLAYSDPGQMDKAGDQWKDTAHKLDGVRQQLEHLAASVPEDKWKEGGRDAFEQALNKYKEELHKTHQFTDDVGGMLKIAGIAFFVFAVLAFAIGSILAVTALGWLAASWTGPIAAALYAAANAIAGVCDTIISVASMSLKAAAMTIGGIIAAGMGVYMYTQHKASDPTGSGPVMFQQATLSPGGAGMPTMP